MRRARRSRPLLSTALAAALFPALLTCGWPACAHALQPDSPLAPETPGEAEAAPPPLPSTRGPEPPVRVGGMWTGMVFEGGSRFSVRWQVTQNAGQLRGTVTENRISGSGYGKYAISGQVTAHGVTYQADNWASRRPPGWCLPAGSLRYSRDAEYEYLSGQLRRNSVSGGCSAHVPTATRNLTSRGDTGRVRADCSNNTTAGACPRFGGGTIKLQRELP